MILTLDSNIKFYYEKNELKWSLIVNNANISGSINFDEMLSMTIQRIARYN